MCVDELMDLLKEMDPTAEVVAAVDYREGVATNVYKDGDKVVIEG